MLRLRLLASLAAVFGPLTLLTPAAAQPTVRQALELAPMQADIEYDRPDVATADQCTIQPEREGDARAWVVLDPSGNLLRRFTDSNADNKIDLWCYFRGGVEVYRDIDANFNEKADQYRWFGTGGSRWGLDLDEDGTIDDWKWISPEEITAELIRAIGARDPKRFNCLLITDEEIRKAGLSEEIVKQLIAQAGNARTTFASFASEQTRITAKSAWVDFSAPQPGAIPVGGPAASQDLVVYENVIAMLETDGQQGELPVGTMVRVDQRWRLIGLPNRDETGFFFRAAERRTLPVAAVSPDSNPQTQQLVQKLEELDKLVTRASGTAADQRVYEQRITVLRELIAASAGEERDMWLLQLIDSVVATTQPVAAGDGVQKLAALAAEVAKSTENREISGQAQFSFLTASYSASLQQSDANLPKIQEKWIADLKGFVETFAGTRAAAEALLQLAISEEFAGEDKDAIRWYAVIIKDHADSDMAEKARGATRRLTSLGKPLTLQGNGLNGSPVDLADLKGNLVAIHYWASWCEPCKQDMEQLRDLLARYGRKKFAVAGVNLDDNPRAAVTFLQQQKMSWPQLHDTGGLESNLAKQMGIFTLPVMLLVDEQGKVINRAITIPELEEELKKRRGDNRR